MNRNQRERPRLADAEFEVRAPVDRELEVRSVARAGALYVLAGDAFETLDDLRSGLFDFSRVEESEDFSRVGDWEDLSLVDSFLPESFDFR